MRVYYSNLTAAVLQPLLSVSFGLLLSICSLLATPRAFAATEQWKSIATDQKLDLKITPPEGFQIDKPVPVVLYLENLSAPRVGTEKDKTILADLHKAGYLLVVLDYHHHSKARVPFINPDLGKLRDALRARTLLSQYKLENAHIYILPSGSRLMRDVLYYPDPKRPLALDIIYPSKPLRPVGAVLEFSCDNQDRMGNTSLSICSDTLLDAEATEGFAVAMADHPVAPPYKGLDAMPDCAVKIKAAVRTLRAAGTNLGLNDQIVPVGFSRGSGMALMLVTTEGMPQFEGRGENTNTSSAVQGAVILSGRFTYLDLLSNDHMLPRYTQVWGERQTHLDVWRQHGAMDYLQHPVMPLFLSINCSESPDALYQMTVLRKRLAELGNDETFFLDPQPRGHKVPLVPEILGSMNQYIHERLESAPQASSTKP